MIPEKTAVRDLGITMSNDASFSIYINEKVAAMNSKISWVVRSFKTRDRLPMLTLWKQLILSDHDYCSQLWSPDKVGDIQSLELLQRSYLRKIHGMQSLSYWDQLQQLGLYSLERRRERYIATYVWKILEGIAPNISDDHGISAQKHPRRGRECRVPKVSTSAPSRIQTIRFSSFAVKGPRIFNSLPKHWWYGGQLQTQAGCLPAEYSRWTTHTWIYSIQNCQQQQYHCLVCPPRPPCPASPGWSCHRHILAGWKGGPNRFALVVWLKEDSVRFSIYFSMTNCNCIMLSTDTMDVF